MKIKKRKLKKSPYDDKNSLKVERYMKENVNSTFHCPFRKKIVHEKIR